MKIIYIAGPMTGLPDFNRPAFKAAALDLSLQGHAVLNPATLPDGLSESQYMDICVAMVRCSNAILMLDGWEQSSGARAEIALAGKLGLEIIYQSCRPYTAGQSQPVVELPELDDDLRDILGRPNFTCTSIAEVLRRSGQDIPRKSENEQAAVIHYLLGHYLADKAGWRSNATAEMKVIASNAAGVKWVQK